ncbi:MAG: PKD domain-containing protein [Patescibacteria group bacterium]|nr:PKD domain-containing protein [bacterium]MDZ4240509.1 PKD domain-containing protein [Patescibacteria group bacterium]
MRFFVPLLLLFPLHSFAALEITEIMYDLPSPGSDTGREWVEIYNQGPEDVVLSGGQDGWRFNDGSNHLFNEPSVENGGQGSFTISPGTFFILAADAHQFIVDHSGFSATIIDTAMSLKNTNTTVSLIDAEGLVRDSAAYSETMGAKGDGNSLQKINGTWGASSPTPGMTNTSSADSPVPSTTDTNSTEQSSTQTPLFVLSASITSGTQTTIGKPIIFEGQAKKDNDLFTSAQYIWTFGDGQGSEGKNVSHTYTSKGTYTVALNVFYEGQTASDTISVTVSEEQLQETPPIQSTSQITDSPPSPQEEKIDEKTPSVSEKKTTKQAYVLPEKSASITPESIVSETEQTAALAAKESPLMPWLVGLGAVVGIPIAFIFFAKPKKNEADEITIIE